MIPSFSTLFTRALSMNLNAAQIAWDDIDDPVRLISCVSRAYLAALGESCLSRSAGTRRAALRASMKQVQTLPLRQFACYMLLEILPDDHQVYEQQAWEAKVTETEQGLKDNLLQLIDQTLSALDYRQPE